MPEIPNSPLTFDSFQAAVTPRGWRAIDRKNGHWQVRKSAINPVVINWWPASANRTVHVFELNRRFDDCGLDAVLAIAGDVFHTHCTQRGAEILHAQQ